MVVLMACECEGPGIESLSNQELTMLANLFRNKTDDLARGTFQAVQREIFKRRTLR